MKQWSIGPGPAGTLIVVGDTENPIPVLIQNVDAANTAYLGETTAVNPSNPLENVPLLPGQSAIATGDINVFAIAAPGQTVALNTSRGFGSFFQPTNLSALGGVAIYNTVTAPTQPPTIPLNSLWFAPNGSINQWNGTSWVALKFSGQQIITASSITAAQLAAGIVYAGIVDATTIQGATLIAGSSPNPQVKITSSASIGIIYFLFNQATVTDGYVQGLWNGTFAQTLLQGPRRTQANFSDWVGLEMNSSDGAATSASTELIYNTGAATPGSLLMLQADWSGIKLYNVSGLSALKPGTGGSAANPAQLETWHQLTLTSATPSGAGVNGMFVRMCADGEIELEYDITIHSATNGLQIATLPTGYIPNTTRNLISNWWGTGPSAYTNTFNPHLSVTGGTGTILQQGIAAAAGTLNVAGCNRIALGTVSNGSSP